MVLLAITFNKIFRMKKLFAILLTSMLFTSCQTWQKVLYGKNGCGDAWQMEKVHSRPSLIR
jgi:hypothetical protein